MRVTQVARDRRRDKPAPLPDATRLRSTGALTRPRSTGLDRRRRHARTALAPLLPDMKPIREKPLQITTSWRWSVRDLNPRPPTCKYQVSRRG